MPHVIPYQGSKRLLAPAILAVLRERLAGQPVRRLYEPFAGSAAMTLAAAHAQRADQHVVADSYGPIVLLWRQIVEAPQLVAEGYRRVWQAGDYDAVRQAFRRDPTPEDLLYLLTRCVKAAVRFNRRGEFNQAADKRRRGTHPDRMAALIAAAAELLRGRTEFPTGSS